MPGPYTRAQLRAQVLRELQDPSGVYFATATVNDLLDEAMAEWCERTRQRRAGMTLDVGANDAIIELSGVLPRVLDVLRVALPTSEGGTDEVALEYLSQEELEARDRNWRLTRGQPTAYLRWDQGAQAIRLYPAPDTAFTAHARDDGRFTSDSAYGLVAGIEGISDVTFDSAFGSLVGAELKYGALRIEYVAGGSPFTDDAGTPLDVSGIPAVYHDAMRDYAVGRCLLMETALKQAERASVYLGRFEAAVTEASNLVRSGFQSKPIPKRIVRENF